VEQLNLITSTISKFTSVIAHSTHGNASSHRQLYVKNYNPRSKSCNEGNQCRRRAENASDVELNGVDGGQVQCHIGPCRTPRDVCLLFRVNGWKGRKKWSERKSLTVAKYIYKHLTMAVSSPGSTLSFSPTCTTPLQIRPDAAILEPWLLYTFEIGILRGPKMSLAGGSSLSVAMKLH
jgi:hypothetical protein